MTNKSQCLKFKIPNLMILKKRHSNIGEIKTIRNYWFLIIFEIWIL